MSFGAVNGILPGMAWWQRPRVEATAVRLAGPTDRPALADLLKRSAHVYGTQAVEEQMGLLNSGVSSLGFAGDNAAGFAGLRLRTPTGQERWADLALVAVASTWAPDRALQGLVESSSPALRSQGVTGIVCLTNESWLRVALLDAGFSQADRVITYARNNRPIATPAASPAYLRSARPADADTILQINAAAFASLWRYDEATTLSWLLTSEHPRLAESDGHAAGFALTTRAAMDGYAQLIRLATHPAWQNQGIGRQLVIDSINYGHRTGALGVALNTQYSNATSRHLYESLGFRTVGPAVEVLVYRL